MHRYTFAPMGNSQQMHGSAAGAASTNNSGGGDGMGASIAKKPSKRAGYENVVGFYLGALPPKQDAKVRWHLLVPLNISKLLSAEPTMVTFKDNAPKDSTPNDNTSDSSMSLYSVATQDGAVLRFNCVHYTGDLLPNNSKKREKFDAPPKSIKEHASMYLANGRVTMLSEYIGNGKRGSNPPPCSFVTAYNVGVTHSSKSDSVLFNTDGLSVSGLDDFNALPVAERIRLAFPNDAQTLSTFDEWDDVIKYLFAAYNDKTRFPDSLEGKDLRKKRNEETYQFISSLRPVYRVSVNNFYVNGKESRIINFMCNAQSNPNVLPVLAPHDALPFEPIPRRETSTALVMNQGSYYSVTVDKDGKITAQKLQATFDFAAASFANGTLVASQALPRCTVFANDLANIGVLIPQWIDRIFQIHPVPFETLLSLDLPEITSESNNSLLSAPGEPFRAGYMRVQASSVAYDLPRYLREAGGGVQVSRDFLVQRYKGSVPNAALLFAGEFESVPMEKTAPSANIADRHKLATYEAFEDIFLNNKNGKNHALLEAGQAWYELLGRDGFYCLDGHTGRPIPSAEETAVEYWAMPLVRAFQLPKIKKADPLCCLPAEHQPEVAAPMTLEEGNKMVLSMLPSTPKVNMDWLDKENSYRPYVLFYVLPKSDPVKDTQRVLDARKKLKELRTPPETATVENLADLPPSVNELAACLAHAQVMDNMGHEKGCVAPYRIAGLAFNPATPKPRTILTMEKEMGLVDDKSDESTNPDVMAAESSLKRERDEKDEKNVDTEEKDEKEEEEKGDEESEEPPKKKRKLPDNAEFEHEDIEDSDD